MKSKIKHLSLFADLLLVNLSFFSIGLYKNEPYETVLSKYFLYLIAFTIIFLFFSLLFEKYESKRSHKPSEVIKRYFFSFSLSAIVGLSLIYILQTDYNSRFIMLGTLLVLFILESIWLLIYFSLRYAVEYDSNIEVIHRQKIEESKKSQSGLITPSDDYVEAKEHEVKVIRDLFGDELINFISKHVNIYSAHTEYFYTSFTFSILSKQHASNTFVNFLRLNDVRRINKLIESVHTKLIDRGLFVCCAETNNICKKRYFTKYSFIVGRFIYFFDFLFRRAWPKIPYLNKLYFGITKGQNRAISHAEILGRLYSCGFELIESKTIKSMNWYIVQKARNPLLYTNPTYGPLIKLKRIGKYGKNIFVYKIRTMHPFSEFLQEYIYEQNYLDEKSKFKDDFRVTTVGKILRKLWIDELPMLYNLLRGDLKLVGVRPLSLHFFNLYPEGMKELRIKHKPGLVPPFYVDLPKSFQEVVESERRYLLKYQKKPFSTDFKYFFKAFYNILFRKARSR